MVSLNSNIFGELEEALEGELLSDEAVRRIYATDASVYREMPIAVAWPKNENDLRLLVKYALSQGIAIVPRSAGTSLAGQAVGSGIVVDVSRHMCEIGEINEQESTVWVEPGVVRDELNRHLESYGLMFAPDTSTSNRATIGGMVGNNSCGSGSIVHGSTRDHVLEVRCVLADGSVTTFGSLDQDNCDRKCSEDSLDGRVHEWIRTTLTLPGISEELRSNCPDEKIRRRNTGYALDLLLRQQPFNLQGEPFNLCSILCGSEGTLALTTKIKVKLVPVPRGESALLVVHMESVGEAARATSTALQHAPKAVELLDRPLLQCAAKNIGQQKNLSFLVGDPGALLVVELMADLEGELLDAISKLQTDLETNGYGYAYPVLRGGDSQAVWNLRKAGLGTLANLGGDAKAVACIEDTAVAVENLPEYLEEFQKILERYERECIYYGHIGDGELHLRPILDLRLGPDRAIFSSLTHDVAKLVKKYRGSLSGEHGDGRVRGSFIKEMVGGTVYELYRSLKSQFDPTKIFNPGKIVDVGDMLSDLRVGEDALVREPIPTIMAFSASRGLERMAANCNGSGDCRKSHHTGGVMCPSYMATRDERTTTRARANLLRDLILTSTDKDPLARKELTEVLDLCLSCKGCKTECPSSVDMAMLKAEVLQHHYDRHGAPLRARLVAEFPLLADIISRLPGAGQLMQLPLVSSGFRALAGFASEGRHLPAIGFKPLRRHYRKHAETLKARGGKSVGSIVLFCDEFTNYSDQGIGHKMITLITSLGYTVILPEHASSARTHISKGFLRRARSIAETNVRLLGPLVSETVPMVGIEPSAILSFRDEYPELVESSLKDEATRLGKCSFLFEEWLANEMAGGRVESGAFHDESREILVHGHCHQKAMSSMKMVTDVLSLPRNYRVSVIPSGCCGMAGSFGYEKEHQKISMDIGELVLFPAVRAAGEFTCIAAAGTSCRAQIIDGTGVRSYHTAEILYDALIEKPTLNG